MKIYNYHPDTGEYISESLADESPLEPGKYLIPAHATNKQPLPQQDKKSVCFQNDNWSYVDVPEPEPIPEPTPEEIAKETLRTLESAIDSFMDSKAKIFGFRDRHSFALRAGITGSSWHSKAQIFGAWMDSVNDYCWQVKTDCENGIRQIPTESQLIAELPILDYGGDLIAN